MNRSDVARGFAWNVLFTLINKVALPVIGILIARILGPEEFGIFSVLSAVIVVIGILRDAGLANTYITDQDKDPKREGTYVTVAFGMACVLALALYESKAWIAAIFGMPQLDWALGVAVWVLVLNGLMAIPTAKLQRQARFRDAGLADTASSAISYVAALIMVLQGWGFAALVYQLLIRYLIYAPTCWFLAPPILGRFRPEVIRSAWSRSVANLGNSMLASVYTLCDNLAIAFLFGHRAVGLYAVAFNVAMKPVEIIAWPLATTVFIAYSRMAQDLERLRGVYYRTVAATAMFTLPLYVFLGFFAYPLMIGLYSEKFLGAEKLLVPMAVYLGFRSVGTLSGTLHVAMGKPGFINYGFSTGLVLAGTGLWLTRGRIDLVQATWLIAAGAAIAYSIATIFAVRQLPPDAKDRMRIRRAGTLVLVTGSATAAVSCLPLNTYALLAVGLVVLPPFHLALVGISFAGSWKACLSPSGLKEVWRSL